MKALEFGSGRSTLWFAAKVGHLTSVEHDGSWYEEVKQRLSASHVTNVDYRHVALDHAQSAPERPNYDPAPDYVAVADSFPDRTLDFVVVDGHYRSNCVKHAVPKISKGGYLLVDDVNMWKSLDDIAVPASWLVVDDSTNGVKRCVIWQAT